MQLTFYKDEQGWFLDAPEYIENELGTKADLQMVCGADKLLDILCVENVKVPFSRSGLFHDMEYKTIDTFSKRIALDIYTDPTEGTTTLMKLPEEGWYIQLTDGHLLWLCPVTKWVFGDYPPFIYYKKV